MMLYAAVIGIDEYRDPSISSLRFAVKDACAFSDVLRRSIEKSELHVHCLVDEEATRFNVLGLIGDNFAKRATEDDIVLVYFACHGSPEISPAVDRTCRYVVLHDSFRESLYSTAIDMERDLVGLMQRLWRPKFALMVFDTCFSGHAGGRTFEGPRLRASRLSFARVMPIKLSEIDWGEGKGLIAACDGDEVALESKDLGHGVFTYHLLEALTAPSDEPTIGLLSLYEDVCARVVKHTNGKQRPIINGRFSLPMFPRLR